MNTKPLFAALALTFALSAPSFAQEVKTKSDDEKTKTKTADASVKTKMADDGKMKVKGKSDAGDKVKATTKPREGAMKKEETAQ